MEREEWMNDQVREKIKELQQSYGFEEEKAVAFWHLLEARQLMVELAIADFDKLHASRAREYKTEGLPIGAYAGRTIADSAQFTAVVEARIAQHFEALYTVLGKRVLRRNYPEGWGWERSAEHDDEE